MTVEKRIQILAQLIDEIIRDKLDSSVFNEDLEYRYFSSREKDRILDGFSDILNEDLEGE